MAIQLYISADCERATNSLKRPIKIYSLKADNESYALSSMYSLHPVFTPVSPEELVETS